LTLGAEGDGFTAARLVSVLAHADRALHVNRVL